jgi:putative transposase
MSDRMTSDLTLTALKMAIRRRQPQKGVLHHPDQGSQHTDGTYQAPLKEQGFQISMNGAGTWYGNAPMESFLGTLKSELVNHHLCDTRDDVRADLFFYIESFCNRRRRHTSLGYLSPEAYEKLYHLNQELRLSPCPQDLVLMTAPS